MNDASSGDPAVDVTKTFFGPGYCVSHAIIIILDRTHGLGSQAAALPHLELPPERHMLEVV